MRLVLIGMVSAIALAGVALAQRERLPAECRQEIMQLCRGSMGGGFRQCVMTALPKLSDPCRKAIGERAAAGSPPAPGTVEHAYGSDPKQRLDRRWPVGSEHLVPDKKKPGVVTVNVFRVARVMQSVKARRRNDMLQPAHAVDQRRVNKELIDLIKSVHRDKHRQWNPNQSRD